MRKWMKKGDRVTVDLKTRKVQGTFDEYDRHTRKLALVILDTTKLHAYIPTSLITPQ